MGIPRIRSTTMSAITASTSAFVGTKVAVRTQRRTKKVAKIAPKAKYGDESVYFDLKDVENTKRYPDRQSEFFENAADALSRREAMFGFLALGGGLSIMLWGAEASKLDLPITKGPQKTPEVGPRGRL